MILAIVALQVLGTDILLLPHYLILWLGTTCGQVNDVNSIDLPHVGTANYYDGEDMIWSFTLTHRDK